MEYRHFVHRRNPHYAFHTNYHSNQPHNYRDRNINRNHRQQWYAYPHYRLSDGKFTTSKKNSPIAGKSFYPHQCHSSSFYPTSGCYPTRRNRHPQPWSLSIRAQAGRLCKTCETPNEHRTKLEFKYGPHLHKQQRAYLHPQQVRALHQYSPGRWLVHDKQGTMTPLSPKSTPLTLQHKNPVNSSAVGNTNRYHCLELFDENPISPQPFDSNFKTVQPLTPNLNQLISMKINGNGGKSTDED
ncbi:unnamed protein product [Cuscuta europaea]|uniref:Uncharacterized protein n=1 Tax=Cuscuta europaea TaxID=41803 RepID=A0A9P1E384_CUSEU|nr:unnamed protein product [Cuscuta europaea]